MTREEKKAKLNSIHIVVTDIIATCDMGLEFTTMTAKGVTTQMGNVFQWPCYVFNNEEKQMQQVVEALRTGKDITNDEILKSLLGETLTTVCDPYNGEFQISDDDLVSEILQMIRDNLKGIQELGSRFYVYASLESWNLQIEFFTTEENLANFFAEVFGTAEVSYESMSDEELDYYYELAEEENFYSLPFIEIGFPEK